MTGHQKVQQPPRGFGSKSKQKHKSKPEPPVLATPSQPTINVDELAREKVEEVERSLKRLTGFKLDSFNSWFSILKQIISAADLHRTSDGPDKENESHTGKPESGGSIYADYSDDNEQFNAHVDLSEQFATNSVKWTIRVQAFKIVHRLVRLLSSPNQNNNTDPARTEPSAILSKYLPDLVRLSFVAATSPYDELKMQGFEMFKLLIDKFATVEEKEFPGHSILEQYKTQVLSAVKPAFNLDAPPYITAMASQICSLWICLGLEKHFSDVKRTYQLMLLSIEKLEGQSENQHSKLYTESELEQERVDILGSWAQLYIAASGCSPPTCHMSALSKVECTNLSQLVKPHLENLVDKWWEALKDYALLIMPSPKFIGTSYNDNEHVYTREVALKLFSPTWPKLVLALSNYLSCIDDVSMTESRSSSDLSPSSSESDGSPRRRRVSKSKYSKFLCGILMKELSKCLVSCQQLIRTGPQKESSEPDSIVISISSLHLLLSDPNTCQVFLEDLSIAQEFYTTLYGIAAGNIVNGYPVEQTLDLLYEMTCKKILAQTVCIQYAVAKLIGSLMTSMKNIEIACKQESSQDESLHWRHLEIRLRNLMTLVKLAPKKIMDEEPLREALIGVFQEMLRFELKPNLNVMSAVNLESLYRAATCEDHRTYLIEQFTPDLCKLIWDAYTSLSTDLETKQTSLIRQKLSNSEIFISATIIGIKYSAAVHRVSLMDQLICSMLGSIKVVIGQKLKQASSSEGKLKIEFVECCMQHLTAVQKQFPEEFQLNFMRDTTKLLYELAVKWQLDVREQIQLENKKLQESKKLSTNVKTSQPDRPTAAKKITLKADFSNFYAKK